MHVPDGFLPLPIILGGYATTGALTWLSLRHIDRLPNPQAAIPRASLLTAAFFVASWIHIPVPPASVHLVLNGLLGTILGYFAIPAIAIGLFFQAIMFNHGGLSTLGVNAAMMGIPALLAHRIFQLRYLFPKSYERIGLGVAAFAAGAFGLGLSAAIFVGLLVTTIPTSLDASTERAAILTLTLAHVPVMAIEGLFTAALVLFLQRVRPQLLEQT
ncbi:MAG: cobalt transporter CbiM [Cyanobacteria bacterium J06642_2]